MTLALGTDSVQGTVELGFRPDLRRTLGPLRVGAGDPTTVFAPDGFWRATRTPEGPATVHIWLDRGDERLVRYATWGPGAGWLAVRVPAMVGACDDLATFDSSAHPAVARLARVLSGLRLTRAGRVLDVLVPTILAQKVVGKEARWAWRGLVRKYGQRAPGPLPLRLAPAASTLAALDYSAFHPLGVERRRADTVRRVARCADRLEHDAGRGADALTRRLGAIPGIGPWTIGEVRLLAIGDADAVSVGDYHLPNLIAWSLAREPRADDARMLELLAPFAPHRGRVVRLLEAGGDPAPRYGPRMPLRLVQRH